MLGRAWREGIKEIWFWENGGNEERLLLRLCLDWENLRLGFWSDFADFGVLFMVLLSCLCNFVCFVLCFFLVNKCRKCSRFPSVQLWALMYFFLTHFNNFFLINLTLLLRIKLTMFLFLKKKKKKKKLTMFFLLK